MGQRAALHPPERSGPQRSPGGGAGLPSTQPAPSRPLTDWDWAGTASRYHPYLQCLLDIRVHGGVCSMKGRKSEQMSDGVNYRGRGCKTKTGNPCRHREDRKKPCQDLGLASWGGAGRGRSAILRCHWRAALGWGPQSPPRSREAASNQGKEKPPNGKTSTDNVRLGERP